jgi:hypothetical protein
MAPRLVERPLIRFLAMCRWRRPSAAIAPRSCYPCQAPTRQLPQIGHPEQLKVFMFGIAFLPALSFLLPAFCSIMLGSVSALTTMILANPVGRSSLVSRDFNSLNFFSLHQGTRQDEEVE